MTTQQIDYVLTLVQEKSFSKAAQKLYITQPSLSQFIKNLENELCIQLFDRSTSPIGLTPAGESYVEAARRIKSIEEDLKNEIADLNSLKRGELTIGTSPFRAACLLAKSIAEFNQRYPGVFLHVVENETAYLEQMLLDGTIDLFLGTGLSNESLLNMEVLTEEQIYLAVPPNNPINNELKSYQVSLNDIKTDSYQLHKTPPIDIGRFHNEQFILQHQRQKLYSIGMKICQEAKFDPKVILHSERLETAFSWALAGIGVTFLPDVLIRFGNYQNHPIYYKIDHSLATRQLIIAYKRNRYLSRASIEYITVLKQLIGYGTWAYQ